MDSSEKKPSDLDLVLLSSAKHSSSVNNWFYMFCFSFSILVYIIHMYVPIHLFYALAPHTTPPPPPPQERSGKVAYSNYFFGGFLTLYLKKYSVISH